MKNIVLIGMPGVGKSTVGVILAKTLGMPFVDTDLIIQEKEGRLLQDIINQDGIGCFMDIEEKIVLSLRFKGSVIATGGSVVYSEHAMNILKQDGTVVYLQLELDRIIERLNNITTRGIVLGKGQSLKDIYIQRVPLYEKYSDISINCYNKSVEDIISAINVEIFDKY